MILIVSACSEALSEEEFVEPLERVVRKAGMECEKIGFKDLGKADLSRYDKFIISGTALKDFGYLEFLDSFKPIVMSGKPVLGICAGAQIILSHFKHRSSQAGIIGKRTIRVEKDSILGKEGEEFQAYFMFSRYISSGEFESLASAGMPVFFQRGRLFASYFHPEVMNPWVIEKFVRLR